MLTGILDNILLNGDFAPDLWTHLAPPGDAIECATWRQTFAVDRWKVRYAAAHGAAVSQAMSADVPAHATAARSLEIRGAHGVTQAVSFGQRIEASEATRYCRRMIFSAWVRLEHPDKEPKHFDLTLGTAREADHFGGAHNDNVQTETCARIEEVPVGRWWFLERDLDGRAFAPHGLSVELEFPAELLDSPKAHIRLASVRLTDVAAGNRAIDRATGVERLLARRFFQRHDASTVNSLGRALVVNAHELHFQFTFPEMRAFPAVTLPHDESHLRVFNLEGIPQAGFAYDITYRSRGSFILRATKADHGLRDGFLSFVGHDGAILLDAEL
jgi:hypothetical protein